MPTRREFVHGLGKTAAGAMVAQLALNGVEARQSGGRKEWTVGGKRVRTIDMHAHAGWFPEVDKFAKGTKLERSGKGNKYDPLLPTQFIPERLKAMDTQGMDIHALSINPSWYSAERDLARDFIKVQNETLAGMCSKAPDRLIAFATSALQHPDLAAEQLEYGIKKLGMKGGSIGSQVGPDELANPRFDPFWAKAQELDAVLFMHPSGPPELRKRVEGNGMLTNIIMLPLGTTIAISHLIFEGVFDRFPRLKICCAHGGGYLMSYPARSDNGCRVFSENCTHNLKKKPTEYMKSNIFVDALVFTPEGVRHLVAEHGASQVVLGTDYPYPWTVTSIETVMAVPGLSDADRIAILGGNAAKLLHL
jgi:aminocarboxymuconate-semialdehyde decarboxylase